MNHVEIIYYKGYTIQALVYKRESPDISPNVRCYDVSVKIGREDDPSVAPKLFRLPKADPFLDLGDARRAGEVFACKLINGNELDTSAEV